MIISQFFPLYHIRSWAERRCSCRPAFPRERLYGHCCSCWTPPASVSDVGLLNSKRIIHRVSKNLNLLGGFLPPVFGLILLPLLPYSLNLRAGSKFRKPIVDSYHARALRESLCRWKRPICCRRFPDRRQRLASSARRQSWNLSRQFVEKINTMRK